MIRRLIFGAVALAAVFGLGREFAQLRYDLARYDRLSEMSGDPSLLRKLMRTLLANVRNQCAGRPLKAGGLLQGLQHDIERYARIKSM